MTWAGIVAFLKTSQILASLAQDFVNAWQSAQVIIITRTKEEREEEREAIIWAMEEARKARDPNKLRALNRSLAALDGNQVMRSGPVQPTES